MSIPSPQALLFDLDGTLVDSLRDIADAMNAVLSDRHWPTHPVEAYRQFVGDGMRMLVRRTHPDPDTLSPAEEDGLIRDMKTAYARCWRNHSLPYPGIPDLLSALADTDCVLGVLSNKPEAFTVEMVSHVFPEVPWKTVRGAREGVPVKPAPDAGQAILQEWGLPAPSLWYVGDTRTDMDFATALGCTPVGVTWGFRDRSELLAHGARILVDHPEQLKQEILQAKLSGPEPGAAP
jgi:phosphoglycolate phosphatase